jgi:hypothetical protein
MSETFGASAGSAGTTTNDFTPGDSAAAAPEATRRESKIVHEAYSFACLNCGFGWEQAYEIEHQLDLQGRTVHVYRANGVRVASPLTRPTCPGCGGHLVRIMRAGNVAAVTLPGARRESAGPRRQQGRDRRTRLEPGQAPEPARSNGRHTPQRPFHGLWGYLRQHLHRGPHGGAGTPGAQ